MSWIITRLHHIRKTPHAARLLQGTVSANEAASTVAQATGSESKVSMAAIKELRSRTGAPIAAVKKALEEENGNIEASIDLLRKLGASMIAKKAHREASEGLVSIAISEDKRTASIIEMNSETDFVARTSQFGELVRSVTHSALSLASQNSADVYNIPLEHLLHGKNNDLHSSAVSSLGENIVLKRASLISVSENSGAIYGYVHGSVRENSGKIGVLVALNGSHTQDIGRRLAMHIAAAAPSYLTVDSIPDAHLEKERLVLSEAARVNNKAEDAPKSSLILDRIVSGRLKKWFSEVVLMEQEMLVEDPLYQGKPRSVCSSIRSVSKDTAIQGFLRFSIGEKVDN
ncbi:Elongation factor Ts [Gracilariopsis chorda]|uniref:Elongation factor Ts, mitochondrial n=1 Tax=Gracilariopsis chorda TaxID=448386 RepID=A0A2V3ICK9_9FLOR|nr:Elongation factor Ts [Gracilariopsis chorda]|eukprot:PXF39825.1 Elongation factor Ts [Gracilariopsis chorda]